MDRASEDDFAAYVGLRWPPLVRTLVLLGCPPDRAEQVTLTALSRVHRSWPRIRRSDDVDVQVFRRLLRTWPATRRRHTRRTALVLHTAGGLSAVQVRAVLGGGAADLDRDLDEDLAGEPAALLGPVPDDIAVGAPPLAALTAGSARSRGVRRRTLVAALSVATLVVAGTVIVVNRDPTVRQGTPPPSATRTVRDVALPYLTDGELHVGRLTVPAPAVTDLVDPGVGAVYRTNEADVVLVDAQGGTAEIGHNAAPGLAADSVRGWVFWLTYTQQLVVYDARRGLAVRSRLAIDPIDSFRFARPLALTEDTAYYLTRRTVRAWDVRRNRVTSVGSPQDPGFLARVGDLVVASTRDNVGLVARRGSKEVWRRDLLRASRALVSPDGRLVLVKDVSSRPRLLDARTGEDLPTGLPVRDRVTGLAFTHDGGVVYVVRRSGSRSALVECRGSEQRCTTLTTVTGGLSVAR